MNTNRITALLPTRPGLAHRVTRTLDDQEAREEARTRAAWKAASQSGGLTGAPAIDPDPWRYAGRSS